MEDYKNRTEYFYEAGSLAELADRIQVPSADLDEEMRKLNNAAAGHVGDPFGRDPVGAGIRKAPFYALGPIKALVGSSGGLKVDREMHVLNEAGQVIRGLYAAGMNGSSNTLIAGHGNALAWAFSTGRIAGVNAAAETPSPAK